MNCPEIAISKVYQVISFDLLEHRERKNENYFIIVWNSVKDLKSISDYVRNNWKEINKNSVNLTVLEGAEDYFTEEKYLEELELWVKNNIWINYIQQIIIWVVTSDYLSCMFRFGD